MLRMKPPKAASHSDAHLVFTCPTCAYEQLMTIFRGLLRSLAAGSTSRAGLREVLHSERWVERCLLGCIQHTGRLQ